MFCAPHTALPPIGICPSLGGRALAISAWLSECQGGPLWSQRQEVSPVYSQIDFNNDFLIDKYFMYSHIKNTPLSLLFIKIICVHGAGLINEKIALPLPIWVQFVLQKGPFLTCEFFLLMITPLFLSNDLLSHELFMISFRPSWLLRQMRIQLTYNFQMPLSSSQQSYSTNLVSSFDYLCNLHFYPHFRCCHHTVYPLIFPFVRGISQQPTFQLLLCVCLSQYHTVTVLCVLQ